MTTNLAQFRSTTLNRLAGVLDGAAAGAYTLPAQIVEAQAKLDRLMAAEPPLTPRRLNEARADLVTRMLTAADDKKPTWPTADVLLDVRREVDAHSLWLEAMTTARQQAASDLAYAFTDRVDLIVETHLRPAFLETLAAAKDAAANTSDVPDTVEQLLRMPSRTRTAWASLDDLATRYELIRNAQRTLQSGAVTHDTGDEFMEMRDVKRLWPTRGGNMAGGPPWPTTTPRARLAWLLQQGADLWMPTAAERDDEWLTTYGDVALRIRQQHRLLMAD